MDVVILRSPLEIAGAKTSSILLTFAQSYEMFLLAALAVLSLTLAPLAAAAAGAGSRGGRRPHRGQRPHRDVDSGA